MNGAGDSSSSEGAGEDAMQQRSIEAAAEFERAIAAAKRDGPSPNVDPRVHVAMIEAMRSELAVLREQLDDS